ncbi:hypothetical protein GQ53DRAFT_835040 [Thozetella sp. PMI_491]|nr:hypothetical protein GQ53DRAFT_835040 [Thozetella sp. PMI_491]
MVVWAALPAEIRAMVLDLLVAEASRKRKAYLFSKFASVSQEWQAVMEPANFKNLTLTESCLPDFERFFKDNLARRQALKRIWFRVELPAYTKDQGAFMENDADQERNDCAFACQMWRLFDILGEWEPKHARLELEITASSPSDQKRYFRNAEAKTARFEGSDLDLDYYEVPELRGPQGLPEVSVITSFCLLRRTYRNISPRALLRIMNSLPEIQQSRVELWEQFSHGDQSEWEVDVAQLVPFWPSSLKKVSLFNSHRGDEYLFEIDDPDNYHRSIPFLSRNLAKMSHRLEEMSSCFVGDARYFFEPFMKIQGGVNPKLPSWDVLTSLTLTSSLISPREDPDDINNLLQAAGNAAKRMPHLRTLELFSAGKHDAGVFLYLATPLTTTASWESTWRLKVSEKVKQTWRAVASMHTRYELEFGREVLLKNYDGVVTFIHTNLATWDVVLHPFTSHALLKGKDMPVP